VHINIFITIDTEHSIGGAFVNPQLKPVGNAKRVFGRIGRSEFGIPLIMDIGDRYGIRFTFFVETLSKYFFGEEETREVCQYILQRGHDIQLHLHPEYLMFSSSLYTPQKPQCSLSAYSLSQQIGLIKDGCETLHNNGVTNIRAFRACGFAASLDTLIALKENGILIDSSYSKFYTKQAEKLFKKYVINDACNTNGIWEFPITNFSEFHTLGLHRTRPLDINGSSLAEMKAALNFAKKHGPRNFTIILHSFSFIKAYDVQYNKMKPRFNIIRRFEKLCQFLSENSQTFKVITFGSLDKQELEKMCSDPVHTFPKVPTHLSFLRYFEQLYDRIF